MLDQKKPVLMIKLGGSLITDKDQRQKARPAVIEHLLLQVSELYQSGDYQLILGHGVGSFGHISAKHYQTSKGLINEESVLGVGIVKDEVLTLHQLVIRTAVKAGLPCFSLAPGSLFSNEEGSPKMFQPPLLNCLKSKLVPVIFGDVITDNSQGVTIYSTEKSFEIVAEQLSHLGFSITVIHLGITDGVYDHEGKVIPHLTPANFKKYSQAIKQSQSVDVTGGMLLKVETAVLMTKLGIATTIANGETANLSNLAKGKLRRGGQTVISSL